MILGFEFILWGEISTINWGEVSRKRPKCTHNNPVKISFGILSGTLQTGPCAPPLVREA